MFGNVVLGIDKDRFEHELPAVKKKRKGQGRRRPRREATATRSIERFKGVVQKETGKDFPQDPREQLAGRPRRRLPVLDEPARRRPTAS